MKYFIVLDDGIKEIEAQRVTKVGPFIIHENVEITWRRDNNLEFSDEYFDKWTITHLDSSFKLCNVKTKKRALRIARALRDSEIEWDRLKRNGTLLTEEARQYFSKNGEYIKRIIIAERLYDDH
jgi:hypothetical protein